MLGLKLNHVSKRGHWYSYKQCYDLMLAMDEEMIQLSACRFQVKRRHHILIIISLTYAICISIQIHIQNCTICISVFVIHFRTNWVIYPPKLIINVFQMNIWSCETLIITKIDTRAYVSVNTLTQTVMEAPWLNKYCCWELFINWNVVHFETNIKSKDSTNMIIPNCLSQTFIYKLTPCGFSRNFWWMNLFRYW